MAFDQKEYQKKYYERNKDKKKEYYEQNKDKVKESGREYRERNKDKKKEYHRKYKERNKDKIKESRKKCHLKKRYELTIEDFNLLVNQQNNRCAICGEEKKLVIDHCHDTGMVRELLCHNCNVGIGSLQESPEILQKAIEYLQKWESMKQTG